MNFQMKYFPRSNQYRASNVYFDVTRKEAFSYNWWKFFAVIGENCVYDSQWIGDCLDVD